MKLITFPGQCASVSLSVLDSLSRQFRYFLEDKSLIDYIARNPLNPGSIVVCSNLFYQLYNSRKNKVPDGKLTFLLGHSLGGLTCLSVNNLYDLTDLFSIANYRNDAMIKCTKAYLKQHKWNEVFEMWTITSLSQDINFL